MTLLDRRVEDLKALDRRIHAAGTFGNWLVLVQEHGTLEAALRAELGVLNRLARGWVYLPPPAGRKA